MTDATPAPPPPAAAATRARAAASASTSTSPRRSSSGSICRCFAPHAYQNLKTMYDDLTVDERRFVRLVPPDNPTALGVVAAAPPHADQRMRRRSRCTTSSTARAARLQRATTTARSAGRAGRRPPPPHARTGAAGGRRRAVAAAASGAARAAGDGVALITNDIGRLDKEAAPLAQGGAWGALSSCRRASASSYSSRHSRRLRGRPPSRLTPPTRASGSAGGGAAIQYGLAPAARFAFAIRSQGHRALAASCRRRPERARVPRAAPRGGARVPPSALQRRAAVVGLPLCGATDLDRSAAETGRRGRRGARGCGVGAAERHAARRTICSSTADPRDLTRARRDQSAGAAGGRRQSLLRALRRAAGRPRVRRPHPPKPTQRRDADGRIAVAGEGAAGAGVNGRSGGWRVGGGCGGRSGGGGTSATARVQVAAAAALSSRRRHERRRRHSAASQAAERGGIVRRARRPS